MLVVFVRKWALSLAFWLCYPLRLRDRVVLASSHTRSLSGNLKAIADELERRGLTDRLVVLSHPPATGFLGKVWSLLWGMKAEFYLATSRVFIVDDYFFPLYVARPKRGTRVIQTWHASGAFKKIGYSVLDKTFGANRSLVRSVRIHSNYDYCLMGSQTSVPAYSEAFGQPAEKFVTDLGVPRTDVFFDEERKAEALQRVVDRYKLPADKRVILYAPTFRGTSKHTASTPEELDLSVLAAALRESWVVLLRLHPFVSKASEMSSDLAGFVFDASGYPDINELMLASDLLITDYSSVIFEYSLLERPMVFFAPDAEQYEDERSFYFDYASGVPGPVFTSTIQVARYIAEESFDLERVKAFRARSFDVADGHASERVVDSLVLPAVKAQ